MSTQSIQFSQGLLVEQASAPVAPMAGILQLWAKTDNTVHFQTSGSVDLPILTTGANVFSGLQTFNAGATVASGQTLTLTGSTVAGSPTWSSNQAITLSTAAQPNITSVGTLSTLTVTAAIIGSVTGSSGSTTGNAATATNFNNGTSSSSGGTVTATTFVGAVTGTASGNLVSGGALGTPSSGTLANVSGLPVSTGISGLGTGVATALAVNVGTAGSVLVNGGSLGTPTSLAIAQGTITTAISPLAITETRNNAGTTFPGITYTITDTASGINSLALQILGGVAGTTHLFDVTKGGTLNLSGAGINAGNMIDFTSSGGSIAKFLGTATTGIAFSSAGGGGGAYNVAITALSAGVLGVSTGAKNAFDGRLKDTSTIMAGVAIASLNAAPTTGEVQSVTDALTPIIGATVAAGGAAKALVWWNGANWTVIGV